MFKLKNTSFCILILKSYVFMILIFSFIACDMFQLRESEKPIISKKDYIPPYSIETVFENLKLAFSNKNLEAYMICFIDTNYSNKKFNFIPSTSLTSSSIFDNWTLQKEFQYFQNFSKNNYDKTINLEYEIISKKSDGAIYEITIQYVILIDDLIQRKFEKYEGFSRFLLEQDSRSYYVIFDWTDIKKSEEAVWTDLKAKYY